MRLLPSFYIGALLLVPGLKGQPEESLQEVLETFLSQAPMEIRYHYRFTQGEYGKDTTGVIVLIEPTVFRLTLWDKVYSSDGTSLYLHDRNTHQTVVDSLQWTEVNLWVRLLNGELPSGSQVTRIESASENLVRWELNHEDPWWVSTVDVDTIAGIISEIRLEEEQGWMHVVKFEKPKPWDQQQRDDYITLQDLPGTRLDLR
ncbi:MAG: hypothetical protein JSW54_13030 [Fidelibacterota bacterium]|nr:MAG: hypothetical protein JSW54_13030 [Candidatus Neomarinimicrobiota bacterium]